MVGTGRRAAGEWTSEGGPYGAQPSRDRRVSHPLSIGARMMVRVSERTFITSIWVVSQKQQLLSHVWGKGFFYWQSVEPSRAGEA